MYLSIGVAVAIVMVDVRGSDDWMADWKMFVNVRCSIYITDNEQAHARFIHSPPPDIAPHSFAQSMQFRRCGARVFALLHVRPRHATQAVSASHEGGRPSWQTTQQNSISM